MSQMLKLSDKNFKAANLTVLDEAKENIFVINEKIENLSTEIENIKKELNGNSRLENIYVKF